MSEINKDDLDALIDATRSARAAERVTSTPRPKHNQQPTPLVDRTVYEPNIKAPNHPIKKTLAATGIVGGAVALGYLAHEAVSAPEISDHTQQVSVVDGDTLEKIVLRSVDGIENVDISEVVNYVKNDPENAKVFVDLETGELSADIYPGEVIVVPESVKP